MKKSLYIAWTSFRNVSQKCLYVWMVLLEPLYLGRLIIIIIIIIIISIFIEDNVFSTTASLPYGPLVNTDIDYFRTFLLSFGLFHIRHAMLLMLYFVLGDLPYHAERQARQSLVPFLKSLVCPARDRTHDLPLPKRTL